jgi:hypothetical protein
VTGTLPYPEPCPSPQSQRPRKNALLVIVTRKVAVPLPKVLTDFMLNIVGYAIPIRILLRSQRDPRRHKVILIIIYVIPI